MSTTPRYGHGWQHAVNNAQIWSARSKYGVQHPNMECYAQIWRWTDVMQSTTPKYGDGSRHAVNNSQIWTARPKYGVKGPNMECNAQIWSATPNGDDWCHAVNNAQIWRWLTSCSQQRPNMECNAQIWRWLMSCSQKRPNMQMADVMQSTTSKYGMPANQIWTLYGTLSRTWVRRAASYWCMRNKW